ncbi:MAG: bifunctional 5,10-methylenetetrahydrofolate dehydrogenase/5,10-methenyltetrahydrofolate cyclohydrolase [Planctomycetota bacterium]
MSRGKLLQGIPVASKILMEAKALVEKLKSERGVTPCLATILVGDDPASATYVSMKGKRCESVGAKPLAIHLPSSTTTQQLLAKIDELNNDKSVHGILLQHPVPPQIDERLCMDRISIAKDVDGVTSHSFGRFTFGIQGAWGCATPYGIMRILDFYKVKTSGCHAVVVGRSTILGKPMAMMLLGADATVTVCHSKTKDLAEHVKRADIVVAAVGKPRFIKGEWIKQGAVVVDAGYNEGNVGDVDFDAALSVSSMITPVPGGVGPVTIATLIDQGVRAADFQSSLATAKR